MNIKNPFSKIMLQECERLSVAESVTSGHLQGADDAPIFFMVVLPFTTLDKKQNTWGSIRSMGCRARVCLEELQQKWNERLFPVLTGVLVLWVMHFRTKARVSLQKRLKAKRCTAEKCRNTMQQIY